MSLVFATRRLIGEELTADHFAELCRMHQDADVMATLGGLRDEASTREYLERNLASWREHGMGVWVVRDRSSGEIAGRSVLRVLELDDVQEVELGYALYPAWWGQGLATEIAEECVRLADQELGLSSVVALTLPTNLKSQRVMTKAGLVFDRELAWRGGPHVLYRRRFMR